MTKHKHHDLIVAWAAGAEIEYRHWASGEWTISVKPAWGEDLEYRIKPEPPARLYPETRMSAGEILNAVPEAREVLSVTATRIANAALRHAIDSGQLVSVDNEVVVMGRASRAARDMAIAQAVDKVYCGLVPIKQRNSDNYLQGIIDTVKD